MIISTLDASDSAAWDAWHATYLASDTHERPFATPYLSKEMRHHFVTPQSGEKDVAFVGTVDGEVAVAAWAEFTLKDNLDMAYLEVQVHPTVRNCGYGSRMLTHLEGFIRSEGRHLVTALANYPYEDGLSGKGHPYADFLTNRGFKFCLGNVRRNVDLPVDPALLQALREEAEPFHADYTFVEFQGPAPDAIVEGLGKLNGLVAAEAPTGDLVLEEEVYDVERMRETEALLEKARRRKYTSVALDAAGEPVAYTDLVVATEDRGKVYQWGTLVMPEHRGRRLGQAVKARNLQMVQNAEEGLTSVSTCNAEVNENMIGINERLGFRAVERLGEFQKRI
jgi:GNAT superfamily N-acetyltransferase